MDVKFVMDKLTFDDERGILAVDTLTGKTVNGPTWGELSVECGDQKICGTAVYQGIEYPVQAVVTVVDAL